MKPTPYTDAVVEYLARTLERYRYTFGSERELHAGIARVLAETGFGYEWEARMSATDRADFFLPSCGVVIEVKVKGSSSSVQRQLERYASLAAVRGIVLATSRMCHPVPARILGKPIARAVLRSL